VGHLVGNDVGALHEEIEHSLGFSFIRLYKYRLMMINQIDSTYIFIVLSINSSTKIYH
jgi:hypothetical protein